MLPSLQPGCFYGELSKTRRVADLTMTEISYPDGHLSPRHSHERPYFSFVLAGTYSRTYGGKQLAFRPTTLVFHPAGVIHSEQIRQTGGRSFFAEIEPEYLNRCQQFPLTENPTAVKGDEARKLALKLYREFQAPDEISPMVVQGVMLELLGEMCRKTQAKAFTRRPAWLDRTREIIHDQFRENLRLEWIAEQVGVHPVYLAAAFRRYFDCTVGDYIRRQRLDRACQSLAESDLPLANIALAVGFSHQAHFNRLFKQQTGMTPSVYRKLFGKS